jgi:hypothetical protein
MTDVRTLYVVARDARGRLFHHKVGRALIEADFDAGLTKLALRRRLEPLVSFVVHSPSQAADAMETLDELGDVEVDPHDFEPEWFEPMECMATIEGLLEHMRRSPRAEIQPELACMRDVLTEVNRRCWKFHLVELLPREACGLKSVPRAEKP